MSSAKGLNEPAFQLKGEARAEQKLQFNLKFLIDSKKPQKKNIF